MMRTGVEIYDDGPYYKNVSREDAIQELRDGGRLCTRKSDDGSCSEQQSVFRTDEAPSQHDETNDVKKWHVDGSTECLLDCLPEAILHDILSRLSICDLLRARETCVAWHRVVSSCKIFQKIYNERNQESWIAIALTNDPQNPDDFCPFNNSNKWFFSQARYQADPAASWLLQGAADGVMLWWLLMP